MAYNIADLFEHAVDAVPERTALIVGDRRRTFAQLEERANRLAHHLADQGVGPGDHVGIYGANSTEWVEAMLAAFKVRAIPVNVNYRYVEAELRYLFDNADLVALVFDAELGSRIAAVRESLPLLRHLICVDDGSGVDVSGLGSIAYDDALASGSPERDFGERSSDDLYVLYTGGTTGMPKGVMWRHEDVFMALGGGIDAYTNERVTSEHQLAEKALANPNQLVSLCLPPLMHGAAQWSVLRFAFEGNCVILQPRFDPVAAWRSVGTDGVNNLMITGDAMGRPLIEALDTMGSDELDLSSLFVVASSAAVFSPAVKDRFLEHLPNLMILDAIGSSETGSNGMMHVGKGNTAMKGGLPTVDPGRDAVVLDDDLRPLEPGTGVVGKLARRGNVPIGYYKDPEKSAATFVTGADGERYAVAGDMALLEADGTITLLGRGSVSINSGGEKIFPEEVESALKAHPAVFDAIVVGVPDDRWGQAVAAVVQARPGEEPTLDSLRDHCRTYIAGYKVPRHLVLVPEVVRSPSGKPDYPWAQRTAAARTP